ncbi:2Fe-2S iron-sulfur cluster binding domain-containing protein [Elizabethkingia anophelis]|uniref:PaaE-like NADH oxidoreductase n=1 Tax=Elizabethkingia anophelis R26 TaxID=1246994 RepID=A0ABN5BQJ5_9FLAO|nr:MULTISPECIES: 2Fe-2S iron-sulfur cluster-binding protein [Elizabethkingia]ATC36118.1 PaaE-like NADH oxidoreductase [Elizabethkingia anophelis R26]ATC39795.1 PaaE-like NADH oxidoreductase [Elizabethkingia anophelis Ag1]ATC43474.1 PaaE-like NADH oxidoreductase [Elizabethkingia anophelis]ATC47150.1 PaaE-like NADH oxidoreductase [Elizabethkingia anophelis]ELR80713.1 PaaE-like NADH oxidoreductase [Elizabethkingia anophelis R26]
MNRFKSLIVTEIIRVTHNAISLTLRIPEKMKHDFTFSPGQYITIKSVLNGKEIRRSYSICSLPNQEDLQIVVKKIENGLFSDHVFNHLKKGTSLEVSTPEGNFMYNATNSNDSTIVAVAAGSGITPIFSIIQKILFHTKNKIILLYGNKNIENTIFYNQLVNLAIDYPERFLLKLFYSEENLPNTTYGRITPEDISKAIKSFTKLDCINDFYICGPEILIRDTESFLLDLGVNKNKIHHELFYTEPVIITPPLNSDNNKTSVKITLDGITEQILVDKNTLLLDSLLEANLDVPYSCQNGICSTCACYLVSGNINMIKNEVLNDEEIKEGKIVTCQSYPLSDTIELNYDI